MRVMKFLILSLFLGLSLAAGPAFAQEDATLFRVADVAVSVDAKSAAEARDQSIVQAQKQAFAQLLTRLGVDGDSSQLTDDTIATLVKAFEVQKEHASSQHYKGTFTVQFKPEAVRSFLNQGGLSFVEARAQPVVVLPLLRAQGQDTLWEDRTPWRDAWEESVKKAVLVPVVVPAGDLDDIAKISAAEALEGKAESLQAIMQKYEAGGVVVAVLNADDEMKDAPIEGSVAVHLYDQGGVSHKRLEMALAPKETAKNLKEELTENVQKIIKALEEDWRQTQAAAKEGGVEGQVLPSIEVNPEAVPPTGMPPAYLPVNVPVPTLAAWAQIRNKMAQAAPVMSTHVVSMTRGMVHVEVQFRSDISTLQSALAEQGLTLEEGSEGGWEIRDDSNGGF